MRITVLGGTGLLGRAVVDAALMRGCQVTSISRGTSGAPRANVQSLFADLATIQGLQDAAGRVRSDVVINCIGALTAPPAQVHEAFNPTHAYLHVLAQPGENAGPPSVEPATGTLIVSPGLLTGPGDNSGLLPSWLQRINDGFQVIVPQDLSAGLHLSDARDVAQQVLQAAISGRVGQARCYGAVPNTNLGELLGLCVAAVQSVSGVPAELLPVPDERLDAAGLGWRELPFWSASGKKPATPQTWGYLDHPRLDPAPSFSLAATVADTWAWMLSGEVFLPPPDAAGPGLTQAQHNALTAHASTGINPVTSMLDLRTRRKEPQ